MVPTAEAEAHTAEILEDIQMNIQQQQLPYTSQKQARKAEIIAGAQDDVCHQQAYQTFETSAAQVHCVTSNCNAPNLANGITLNPMFLSETRKQQTLLPATSARHLALWGFSANNNSLQQQIP